MQWLKSKTTLIAAPMLAIIGLQAYGLRSVRSSMEQRVASVEQQLQSMHDQDNVKLTQLASDIDAVAQRMGVTAQELQQSRSLAEQLKKDNEQNSQRMRRELAS